MEHEQVSNTQHCAISPPPRASLPHSVLTVVLCCCCVVMKGAGTPLGQIPNVAQRLEKTKTSAPEIRRLYSLCYPLLRGLPTKLKIKPMLRSFNGLTRDDQRVSARGKMRRMLKEEKVPVIGRLLLLMDLDFEEGKEKEKEMVDRVMQWLDTPTATGREFQTIPTKFMDRRATGSKKRRRRSSVGGATGSKKKRSRGVGSGSSGGGSDSSGSGSDSSDGSPARKPKGSPSSRGKKGGGRRRSEGKSSFRTANSFLVFSSAKRDELRELHPELSAQEVTSRLSQMWKDVMPEEKEVYELAAKRLREDAKKEEQNKQRRRQSSSSAKKKKRTPSSSSKQSASASKREREEGTSTKKRRKVERKSAATDSSDSASSGSGSGSGSDSGTEDEDEAMEEAASAAQSTATSTSSSTTASPRAAAVKVEAVDANGNEEKEDINAAIKEEEERKQGKAHGEVKAEAKAESS